MIRYCFSFFSLEIREKVRTLNSNDGSSSYRSKQQDLSGSLKLNNFPNLIEINLSGNKLTNLDLSEINKEKLIKLNVSNIQSTNVHFLSGLVNLEELYWSSSFRD